MRLGRQQTGQSSTKSWSVPSDGSTGRSIRSPQVAQLHDVLSMAARIIRADATDPMTTFRPVLSFLPAALLPLLSAGGCSSLPDGMAGRVEVALEAGQKLGGCAVGDLLPANAGDEIVALGEDGRIYCTYWIDEGRHEGTPVGRWHTEEVFRCPGEMIQVTIGDADPFREGLEVVAVGSFTGPEDPKTQGAVWILGRKDGEWWAEQVLTAPNLVHGVAVHKEGIVAAGYGRAAWRLVRSGQGWERTGIGPLPGDGKAVVDLGGAVAIGCTDGSLVRAFVVQGKWQLATLDSRDAARSRLATLDGAIVSANDDGSLTLLPVGAQESELLHKESQKLRGAWIGEFGSIPGPAVATVGYSGRVTVMRQDYQGPWREWVIYEDTDRLHHLGSGDVYGDGRTVLVACGFSGRVVVLRD